ncbi:MAG TPA: cytochrome b N-terminal domain-containing protein [Verrucomicrobiae bacterium]|nr:cytochrome b N-terminal domain-containing protein [Verrucomicrobiae bacterium]
MKKLYRFLDERLGLEAFANFWLRKLLPPSTNWLFTLGGAALFLFAVQIATGIFLALYYAPTPDGAHASVTYIQEKVLFGKIIRGIHNWAASFLMVIVPLHLLRVFFWGAYKKPRELTWIFGVCLFLLTAAFAFTGYLLPWDQKGYWATVVGTNMMGLVPVVGEYILKIVRGGMELGALALTRFYAVHVLILPVLLIFFLGLHLFLISKHGSAGSWDESRNDLSKGFPFYPKQAGRDLAISFALISALLILAWKIGAPLDEPADPADETYIPRPDWYFLFLFQLLKYFPGKWEIFGALVIPGVFVTLLLLLPFIDKKPRKAPYRRPLALLFGGGAVFAFVFLTLLAVKEDLKIRAEQAEAARFDPAWAQEGEKLFTDNGCDGCHLEGGRKTGTGPSLIGSARRHPQEWLIQHFKDPKSVSPGSTMPKFDYLREEEMIKLIHYIKSLKKIPPN